MSVLISDLKSVPGIIGALGLGIADAQKEMNADYLRSIGVLVDLIRGLIATGDTKEPGTPEEKSLSERRDWMKELLLQLAPPRYQYTRTELHVRMDLSQITDKAISVGGGVTLGAIAVNGSFAMSQTQEYRAAAECHTVIDAVWPTATNPGIFRELAAHARKLPPTALPATTLTHDKETMELAKALNEKLDLPVKTTAAPQTTAAPSGGATGG